MVSHVLNGEERLQFQPPHPSRTWEWMACKVTAPQSDVLCSGFKAVSNGCLELLAVSCLFQICVASFSESWGFRLLLLQCKSEPRGSSPHENNLLQCGHKGRGKVGWQEELEEASRPPKTAGNGHGVV